MTQSDLETAYGQADSTVPDQDTSRLIFGSHHMDVYLRAGIVIGIRIYDGSDLKFEQSVWAQRHGRILCQSLWLGNDADRSGRWGFHFSCL